MRIGEGGAFGFHRFCSRAPSATEVHFGPIADLAAATGPAPPKRWPPSSVMGSERMIGLSLTVPDPEKRIGTRRLCVRDEVSSRTMFEPVLDADPLVSETDPSSYSIANSETEASSPSIS